MCEYAAATDARAQRVGSYSSWLTKVKGEGARAKWFNSSTKRYFTIDFDSRIFFYSHNEDRKKISQPIRFEEILGAEQLPRPAQAAKHSSEHTFGFALRTQDRRYELYTITYLEAEHWVDGLNAARDIANGVAAPQRAEAEVTSFQPAKDRELSRSSFSTTADGGSECGNGGSDSGRSTDRGFLNDRNRGASSNSGLPPPGPPIGRSTTGQSSNGQPPWAPPPARPLVAAARPQAATSSPPASWEPAPATVGDDGDPFAALDALEELAGPAPEAVYTGTKEQAALLREAHSAVKQGRAPPRPGSAAGYGGGAAPITPPATTAAASTSHALPTFGGYGGGAPAVPLAPAAPSGIADATPLPVAPQPRSQPQQPPVAALAPASAPAPREMPPVVPSPAPAPVAAVLPVAAAPVARQQPQPPMPAVAAPAVSYHKPAADSWDSDDDSPVARRGGDLGTESPSAYRPSAAGPAEPGVAAPVQSQQPQYQVPSAGQGNEASGWDSDDDAKPSGHRAPAAPAAGGRTFDAVAMEPSDWDEPEVVPQQRLSSSDVCGAPARPAQAFVAARAPPVPAATGGTADTDLDDLVGEVLAAGSSRAAGSYLVPGFHCMNCDLQVLCIEGSIWGTDVEYMFFRNNYPNVQKLRPKLHVQDGCVAYCCQCSSKSAHAAAELVDVAEGLRWKLVRT